MLIRRDILKLAGGAATRLSMGLAAVAVIVVLTGTVDARAQEGGTSREQLDRVLAVLRLKQTAASKACLDVMAQVHATEQQVKEHQGDVGNHPDLDIARDVMDSDYQNGTVICGADAERACRQPHDADLTKPCAALHHDP